MTVYDGFDDYCKTDYSRREAHIVKTTQIRLYKMRKNLTMTSFFLVSKIWKKIIFYVAIRRQKNTKN